MSEPSSSMTCAVHGLPGETLEQSAARALLNPTLTAAQTLFRLGELFNPAGSTTADFQAMVSELEMQAQAVNRNNLSRPEAMLAAQMHTLDALFGVLLRRGAANVGEYPAAAETYMKLALRAQSQCRSTAEALAVMKNPSTFAVVKQANIAHTQQVNNRLARPKRKQNQPNKLLGAPSGSRLDAGAQSQAVETDSHMAAVVPIHRPEVIGGQSHSRKKCIQGGRA